MKKFLQISILVTLAGMTSTASAAHCINASRISRAAHQMGSAASHFHSVIHGMVGYSHLASDVHSLSRSANHLHRLAERNMSSCRHLRRDFRSVSRAYNHL